MSQGAGYAYSVLHAFAGGSDGSAPYAPLIMDASGALYGTTSGYPAGHSDYGTVFKLTPEGSGYGETILYAFEGAGDGAYPVAALIEGPNATLYGTPEYGRNMRCGHRLFKGCGTVFAISQ